MTKWDLFQKCKGGSTEENKRYKNNINRTKEKKDTDIPQVILKRHLIKLTTPSLKKILRKLRMEENFLKVTEGIPKKPTDKILLNDES